MNNTQKFIHWITLTLREAAWAPLSVIFFYGLGLAFHWFDAYPKLDIPAHLMGGVAITYFYRAGIRTAQQYLGDIPLPIQILLAITSTGTTAILWEFYENLSDYLIATQHVKGLADTIQDLFVGLLGAVLLSLFYKRR